MDLKEKLLDLKNKTFMVQSQKSRDFEFDATLEDHLIGNQEVYRLYYVNYDRVLEYSGRRDNNISVIEASYKPFLLPKGMTRMEGFKVLSYLTDFIEKREDVEDCSWKSVEMLDNVLNLEELGFTRSQENNEDNILNLFTINGRLLLFKKSALYQKYFEWYTENVTFDEIVAIYFKYNMEFRTPVWNDNILNIKETKHIKKLINKECKRNSKKNMAE